MSSEGSSTLALPENADVVVVGGDLAGLACASALARFGASVVVLESREEGKPGGAGRDNGILLPGLSDSVHRLVEVLGAEDCGLLFDMARISKQRLAELGCFSPTGVVLASLSPAEADALELDLKCYGSLGWQAETFQPPELMRSRGIGSGLILEEAGITDPSQAVAALANEARSRGASLVHGVRVHDVEDIDDGLQVHCSQGSIRAELLVHTTGWSLVEWLPWAREKLYPVRLQHLVLEEELPVLSQPMVLQYGHSWARSCPEGLLTGGCRWASPHLEVGEFNEQKLSEQVGSSVLSRAQALFGVDLPIARQWGQIATFTCDGLPFIGTLPGSARQMVCTGWNGRPWSMALAAGELVASGIAGENTDALPRCVSSYRMV
jgi:glycine/D-amino acid oxidase-like deaminating enzyme